MAEQEEHEARIAAGFNAGYLMSEHEPELLQKIASSDNQKSDFIQSMTSGHQQFQREKVIEQQEQIKARKQERKRGR